MQYEDYKFKYSEKKTFTKAWEKTILAHYAMLSAVNIC